MTKRRDFLGLLGASSLLAAVGSPQDAFAEAPPVGSEPISDKFDMNWCNRLPGKQVGVFDSPELAEGAALWRAVAWRQQHAQVFGTAPSAMVPVVVFRHMSIPLAMGDAYWERFNIGKEVKMKDFGTKKWAMRNPVGAAAPGTPAEYADTHLEPFINSGGIVLACDLAFQSCVDRVMKADKLEHAEAYDKAKTMLWPGVILQPSGFFAVLKAQETGGGYILAS